MHDMKLHTKIILGMLLGIGWALASAYWSGASFTQDWIAPFGTIFINALKLIAILSHQKKWMQYFFVFLFEISIHH